MLDVIVKTSTCSNPQMCSSRWMVSSTRLTSAPYASSSSPASRAQVKHSVDRALFCALIAYIACLCPPCRYRIGAALQKLPSSVRSRRCRTFLGRAAFGGICPVISVVTIIHTMVTRVNRKDPNFSLILHRIKNHMRKKAYDSVIQSKKNRSGTGDVGKKQCCTKRTPLLRLTLLYRKNRLHYGKRFHTNCYAETNLTWR